MKTLADRWHQEALSQRSRMPRIRGLALLAVALLLGIGASSARASSSGAGSAASSVAADSLFCQEAVIFGKHSVPLQTLPSATLKADYAQFKTLEAKMVAAAPGSIRTDLKQIFTFDLGLFSALSKAGWSFAKLPHSVLAQWAVAGPKLKPASDKVISYIDATCGLKLRKP